MFFEIYDGTNLVSTIEQTANNPVVTTYAHADHLGSSSLVTDSAGTIVQQLDYLPYGEERVAVKAANTSDLSKKYTGKELDEETGLYYYGARYYDSRIARFVSVDPVAKQGESLQLFINPQRFNTYSYAINNPVVYNDPTGLSAFGATMPSMGLPTITLPAGAYSFGGAWIMPNAGRAIGQAIAANAGRAVRVVGRALPITGFIYGVFGNPDIAGEPDYDYEADAKRDINKGKVASPPTVQPKSGKKTFNPQDVPENVRKQIPQEWGKGEPSGNDNGWRWNDPKNKNKTVRYGKGNPNSPDPSERNPYVKQTGTDGQPKDINGKPIQQKLGGRPPSRTPEAHVSPDKWNYFSD